MTELVVPKGQPISGDPEKKGWLFKWTNYLKGYQRRWFVLSNGLLSYYRNQAEMAHTCRGTISLLGALIHTADSCTFVISNGGTQTFHIRAHDEIERQSWVTALEFAKAKAIRATESDEDEEEGGSTAERARGIGSAGEGGADAAGARELAARFDDLRTCSELVARHGAALQRALADLEVPPHDQAKQLAERATLFRIACNAMMNACSEYMTAAQASSGRLGRALQHEREQKLRLQEVVEQLARQHDNLEKTVSARAVSQAAGQCAETDEEEEHEFFDAQDESGGTSSTFTGAETSFIIKLPVNRKSQMQHGESSDDSEVETVTETQQVLFVEDKERRNGKMGGTDRETTQGQDNETTDGMQALTGTSALTTRKKSTDQTLPGVFPHVTQLTQTDRPRRQRVPDKPNYPLNLWSIMKNCIGKELSKIPIPVNFSEPLSMLQRLTEDYEYSSILDVAARCEDACEQLAYIAAFTVSSYATTSFRTNKPFNPLLGETYECDRMADLGWRVIAEQVSHHPPMVAQHVEGASGWRCWQEFTMTSKFRGKYLQVIPLGSGECQFIATGNKYSWRKVTTTVHNIIVGKLWVDQHGDMDIVGSEGRAAGITCHLKYLPYSYFSKDTQRKVTGVVKDAYGTPKWVIQGYWDRRIEIAPVTSASSDNTVCKTGKLTTVWESIPPPPDSDKWYNFTLLAAQLNEPEPGVAPTDSRHRPDQRLMEEGLWDEANTEKLRLEEKQRAKRRENERAAEEAAAAGRPAPPGHRPVWFTRETVADNTLRHVYAGQYWQCKERQDWGRCPDIF